MMKVEPYLIFNGNCEEAFEFYKSVFKSQFDAKVMKYSDIPEAEAMNIPEEYKGKVMHVNLPVGENTVLMGSDAGPGSKDIIVGNNVILTLSLDNEEETRRIFKELSEGGSVIMELDKTFWAKLYGMFTDKFGIVWNINYGYEDMEEK